MRPPIPTSSRVRTAALFLLLGLLLTPLGCAGGLELPAILTGGGTAPTREVLTATSVSLDQGNYRVVRSNVVGESRGLKLLFLITVDPASHTEAFSDLYRKAALGSGRSQAIVHVVHERTERNFLLFSLPRITVRADVVEFEPAAEELR